MMPSTIRFCLALAAGLAVLGGAGTAEATYSIAAFDRETGRFGAATASCVPIEVMRMVYAQVPGEGAALTQSYLLPNEAARAFALAALAEGESAVDVLGGLTDPMFDPDFELRQYAVLDPNGGVASFTGSMAEPYAADLAMSQGAFELVVAGNFLTGEEVLLDASEAFFSEACDLEARLMNALMAASVDGRGDARCVVDGVPAQSALIHVGRPDTDLDLEIGLPSPPPDDPVRLLAAELEAWRAEHPCPTSEEPSEGEPEATEGGCVIGGDGRADTGWVLLLAVWLSRRRPA